MYNKSSITHMKPKIHFFNPGYESGIALYALNGSTNYTPSLKVRQMQQDLALLPLWFAEPQDYIWLGEIKTETNKEAFTNIPSFLPEELPALATPISISILNNPGFHLPETEIAPWGLSPQTIRFFEKVKKASGQPILTPPWNDKLIHLINRRTAADCLDQLLKHFPDIPSHSPVFCSSIGQLEEYMTNHVPPHIIKTPYSSSGRGVYEITGNRLQENERRWISGAIQKQGSVSIEPKLDKKIDFAMEYQLSKDGEISFEGFSLFDTTPSGSYIGNRLAPQNKIEEYIGKPIGIHLLHEIKETTGLLLKQIYGKDYSGNIGVDMMIYTDSTGNFAIHPCVEINMRNTMGMISIHLFKQFIDPSATGYFKVVYEKDAYTQHRIMQNSHPQEWRDGKLSKGYLSLCPVNPETLYRAYILMDREDS